MDLQQRVEELERQLEALKEGRDVQVMENIRRYSLQGTINAGVISAATGTTKAVNEAGSAAYSVADAPDQKVIVELDGTSYYLPLYNV